MDQKDIKTIFNLCRDTLLYILFLYYFSPRSKFYKPHSHGGGREVPRVNFDEGKMIAWYEMR